MITTALPSSSTSPLRMLWTGSVRALEMLRVGEITAIFRIPQYPFRFVWVFGCLVLLAVLVAQFIESLVKVIKK
jgi:hypothetical protein